VFGCDKLSSYQSLVSLIVIEFLNINSIHAEFFFVGFDILQKSSSISDCGSHQTHNRNVHNGHKQFADVTTLVLVGGSGSADEVLEQVEDNNHADLVN